MLQTGPDPDDDAAPVDGARDTHAAVRLRGTPRLVAALSGDASRSTRCRLLRKLPRLCIGARRREALLLALMRALGERDPEVRVAALDGLHALAEAAPRLRNRVRGLLALAALAPSRSTAMHAATLCGALDGVRGGRSL